MKGLFTLGIYIAIGITGAAFGQAADEPLPGQPLYKAPPTYSPIPPRNGEGVRADPVAARLGNHGACYADDKAAAAAAKGGGVEVWQRRADR